MGIIKLEGLEFFGYHGQQDEEQSIGNRFSVDVEIKSDINKAAKSDNLKDTINYAEVYHAVKETMNQKHRLLEHVAYNIIQTLRSNFPEVKKIKVAVTKFNPPIGGICKKAIIELEG